MPYNGPATDGPKPLASPAPPPAKYPPVGHELESLLSKARDLNKGESGMARISVRFEPYKALWHATASWSCGRRIDASDEEVALALAQLATLLDAELAALVS